MQNRRQAETFIRTLEEMLEEDREIRRARRLRQSKALARRSVQAFPAAYDDLRFWPDRAEWDTRSVRQVLPQMQSD